MRLPDINEVYPQSEQLPVTSCVRCTETIFEGEEFVESDSYDYCSIGCFVAQALEDGTIKQVDAKRG